MSFRARLFAGFAAVVVLPLVILLLGVRAEVGKRLTAQFSERANAVASVIMTDLDAQGVRLGQQLAAIAEDMGSDNRFRLALRTPGDRRYLLDYAGTVMRRAGLAALHIQDSAGRVLSSGHFRNEYDRVGPPLGRMLAAVPAGAFVRLRVPDGEIVVLARAAAATIAGERLFVLGGLDVTREILGKYSEDPQLSVRLAGPADTAAVAPDAAVATLDVPFMDSVGDSLAQGSGRIVITQSRVPLRGLQRSVDRWFLAAGFVTLALALAAALWLSSRVSRPVLDLADKAAHLDLDRLDVDFAQESEDEIGALSRMLAEMTGRLRSSMTRLREAERRATVGDLARQLNHDVKNGLVPVRNVFRHLAQVARDEPARLPAVLLERQGTIEAGISYLENLAKNYARLSPELNLRPCDLNQTVTEVVQGSGGGGIQLELGNVPPVAADPLVVRRIVENLLSNAIDSMNGTMGVVKIATASSSNPVGSSSMDGSDTEGSRSRVSPRVPRSALPAASMVRLVVADEGKGMTEAELERAFEDFYTTKPGGTGLGLSIVRRLVLDLNGSLRVETAPGSGTRVIIELPVAT